MPAYLTLADFKARTRVPRATVDFVESRDPGWTDIQLDETSAWIDSRLAKRYAAPFASPAPKAVTRWLTLIVSAAVYDKRGVEALDEQSQRYYDAEKDAKTEIAEAANSENGLFDLPLRADTSESGIIRGGPRGYSEQSPYVWMDRQRRTARDEDSSGEGSSG